MAVKAIKIGSYSEPVFLLSKVTQKQMLNYANLGENSNKFYYLEIQEGTGQYSHRVFTRYGRVGRNEIQEGRYFNSFWAARECFDELIAKKTAKGYRLIDLEGEAPTVRTRIKTPPPDLKIIPDKTLRLVAKFYHEAIGFVTGSIETPLGKISANQVAKGYRILDEIEHMLNQSSQSFEYLSNDFYSIIPVIFGNRVDKQKMLINSFQKLMERREMLDVMNSIVDAQKNLNATIEEKYKSLNATIEPASKEESARIKKFITSSQSPHHHFNIKTLDVFTVKNMVGHDQFNPFKVSTRELFHGSRNCNMLGIMQHGLKIKPSAAIHTGSMFGEGIYFADQSSKSANYCWGFGSSDQSLDTNFLLVCEVATGKIKEFTDPQYCLKSAPRGFNSVMGKRGSSLLHDEFIVYRENQAQITHIVEFQR